MDIHEIACDTTKAEHASGPSVGIGLLSGRQGIDDEGAIDSLHCDMRVRIRTEVG